MDKTLNQLHKFHGSRSGKIFFAAAELLLAYAVFSYAIDTGNLLLYLLFLLLFIGVVKNLVGSILIKKSHGRTKAKKR